ncbi:MAG: hypothetical protein V3T84_02100 [Phycisphaerales bacterium]
MVDTCSRQWRVMGRPVRRFVLTLATATCCGVLAGCPPINPCGVFVYTGSIVDTSSNGVDMSLSFDFDPAACGRSCSSELIPYVQMVRTWSFEDGTPLYPSAEKEDRATKNGWYIDRVAGRIWGYYGRNDDGSFAPYLTPGTNSTLAVLGDSPRRPDSSPWLNIWWHAVSVTVDIDSASSCEDEFLGYYTWGWFVDSGGTVTNQHDSVAWKSLGRTMFDAVDEWNLQAPGLVKNNFPAFTSMPDIN